MQGLQYVVPLLLLPLVAGWLGLLEFGRLFWFVSAFALVNAASGFGLEWSGTRKLAQASARTADWGSTVASLLRLRLAVTLLGLVLLWVALWVALGTAPSPGELVVMVLLSVDSLANARYPNYAFFAAGQAPRAARVLGRGWCAPVGCAAYADGGHRHPQERITLFLHPRTDRSGLLTAQVDELIQ